MATEKELYAEIEVLKKKLEVANNRIKTEKYGITWLEVPEAFEEESENQLPILTEVKEKAIKNEDGKPTHILIEGDNYHSLTCLNYTHKGKIDLIYIDPPYNTGSDGFRYKDKRVLDKYPDGTEVPKDHPLRHSYWLSFMYKRLDLAKSLLVNNGIIFISIDNNEFAQLKLLCDQIFGEDSFVENFIWNKTSTPPALSYKSRKTHEYILCYQKIKNSERFVGLINEGGDAPILNATNKYGKLNFPAMYIQTKLKDGVYKKGERKNVFLENDVNVKNGIILNEFALSGHFRWSQKTLDEEIKNETKLIVKSKEFAIRYGRKGKRNVAPPNFLTERFYNSNVDKKNSEVDTNEMAGKELREILGSKKFDFPKPVSLIKYLLSFKLSKKSTNVLDFFAGSGTTLHACLDLNNQGYNIQNIMCTNDEGNICTEVTYPRGKKVIEGYTDLKKNKIQGLGNSLKYYKTDFVGKHNILWATDEDKSSLAHKAGYLLAISENTLEEIALSNCFQFFENDKKVTAIYFKGVMTEMQIFLKKVENIKKPINLYLFSWLEQSEFEPLFNHLEHIKIKTIPKPILDIYKKIYNIVTL